MAISFSRPDPSSPTAVAGATFPSSRRGFDQNEVRDFLRMVSAEISRQQERITFLERELLNSQQAGTAPQVELNEETITELLAKRPPVLSRLPARLRARSRFDLKKLRRVWCAKLPMKQRGFVKMPN